MKKKNPLSVFTFPYRPVHYLTHPWKLFHDMYWNIRNFWHRGRFGYAYVDVWNFCDWYPRVGAAALRYLALHKSGYPGVYPWNTPEAWKAYLLYLSRRLERCANSQDICFGEERNEYAEDFHALMNSTRECREENDTVIWTHRDFTPEEQELCEKYWAREKQIRKVDQEYIEETFKWIGQDLPRLWD